MDGNGVGFDVHESESAMILAWIDVTQNLTRLTAEGVKVIPLDAMPRLTEGHLAQLSEMATAGLCAEQIKSLSPEQVAALQYLDWISPQATAGFTPEQITHLSLEQFATLNYPDWLGPEVVASLDSEHISLMSVNWGWMTDDWIAALSPDVMPTIEPAILSQLTASATTGFAAEQLRQMHPDQIGALKYPQALSHEALSALNVEQRQALPPA